MRVARRRKKSTGLNASSNRPSRKGRLSESTTRPLESSESRELAIGDRRSRAIAGQPLEAVAIIGVDEAIGVGRVAVEECGSAERRIEDPCGDLFRSRRRRQIDFRGRVIRRARA